MSSLDRTTLEAISDLICDDNGPHYRKGWQLARFLRDAGWKEVEDFESEDGIPRRKWIFDALWAAREDDQAIHQILCRIADTREYPGEQDAPMLVCDQLNRIIGREGLKVVYERGRPIVVEVEPVLTSPASSAPVSLKADLEKIIANHEYANILRTRFDEAATCRAYGAHVMAMIALGSFLEGVLHAVALQENLAGNRQWNLEQLIDLAYSKNWIARDRQRFSHTLREYRNLVHPHAQLRKRETPDANTVAVCWEVAVAALNDLGDKFSR